MKDEKQKILFENTTNFTAREVRAFNKFTMLPIFIKIGIVMPLLLIAFGFYMLLDNYLIVAIVMWCASLICAGLMPVIYLKTIKNSVKTNRLLSSNTFIDYKFEEEGVRTTTRKGEVIIGNFAIDYKMVFTVYEANDFLYFFVSGSQAYILDKNGMTDGKIEDLVAFLKTKEFTYKDKSKHKK